MRVGNLKWILCVLVVAILAAVVGTKVIALWYSANLSSNKSSVAKSSATQKLDYQIKVESAHKELSAKFYWFHPYLAAIPGAGKEELPAVILLCQKHLEADDHYSNTYMMRTDDMGKTWSGPTAVPQLKWMSEDGYDLSVSSAVPNWHPQTKKLLAIGHSNLHNRPSGFVDKAGACWAFYTTYDPKTNHWTDWAPLGDRGREEYSVACGCDQWLIEPDGTILLPVYLQRAKGPTWDVQVWKCSFDGEKMKILEKGNLLVRYQTYGIHEPSITKFKGQYWLTIRENDTALFTNSKDGLHYSPLVVWKFDDGEPLGNYCTQQHWVTRDDALFLTYTRRGANNNDIIRNRAPTFIAQVDPYRRVALRKTERILFPNRGVAQGNFGVNNITPDETWVSVGEQMTLLNGKLPTDRGAEGAILIGRILWSKPNRSE